MTQPRGTQPGEAQPERVLRLGNEFSEVVLELAQTRNGVRLVVTAPKSGRSISLCPLEVEALTWQNTETFSAMIGKPSEPLIPDGEGDE